MDRCRPHLEAERGRTQLVPVSRLELQVGPRCKAQAIPKINKHINALRPLKRQPYLPGRQTSRRHLPDGSLQALKGDGIGIIIIDLEDRSNPLQHHELSLSAGGRGAL